LLPQNKKKGNLGRKMDVEEKVAQREWGNNFKWLSFAILKNIINTDFP
jgi:hypothetical protein